MIDRSSVDKYRFLTLAFNASNTGDNCSLGLNRMSLLSRCPMELSPEEFAATIAAPPLPPPVSTLSISFLGSL